MEWSPQEGGASVVGYTLHYTDSDGGTVSANSNTNSVDITGFTIGETYTITVEARSDHLSGESKKTFTLSRSISLVYSQCHLKTLQ